MKVRWTSCQNKAVGWVAATITEQSHINKLVLLKTYDGFIILNLKLAIMWKLGKLYSMSLYKKRFKRIKFTSLLSTYSEFFFFTMVTSPCITSAKLFFSFRMHSEEYCTATFIVFHLSFKTVHLSEWILTFQTKKNHKYQIWKVQQLGKSGLVF